MYYHICSTYEIKGFPTILGWKQGGSFAERGLELNSEHDIYPELVAEELGFDLAHEAVELFDWDVEDEETKRKIEAKLIEQAHKAARKKRAWHEHEPHTRNDRFHNAALSLAFAIKSQLFQTVTREGKMEPKRRAALHDFLNLLDWASPRSWSLRGGLARELRRGIAAGAVRDRSDVESIIEDDVAAHRSGRTGDLWGHVEPGEEIWLGRRPQSELAEEDQRWTKSCTHSVPAKGFTCGLWNLFHILTIGASKTDHEIYGFRRGYVVTHQEVARNVRDFVAYFFSCDVCRTNFLKMYDNCGHNHCNRLKSEFLTGGPTDGSDPAHRELALWLWEVHNSVNARLMKEAALRQNRNVTEEETLASRFPTATMCPDCWLDENMTKWDNDAVFRFLDEWYWPAEEPADEQFRSVIAGTAEYEDEAQIMTDRRDVHPRAVHWRRSRGLSPSLVGVALASLSLLVILVAVRSKRRERRKKFVDSRFVKKRQGSSSGVAAVWGWWRNFTLG